MPAIFQLPLTKAVPVFTVSSPVSNPTTSCGEIV